jgi:serpin B
VSQQTRGKIPTIVEPPISPDVVAYLINAIYFKGDWTMQFDKSLTKPAPFTLRAGDTTTVQMMSHGVMVDIGFHGEPDVVVFDLPYGGSAFSMTVVLPRTGAAVDSVLLSLDETRWNAWIAALNTMEVYVYLPKFTVTYGLTMNHVLKALGMPSAFCDSGHADFTQMVSNLGLCITDVKHKAFVDVNEEGTEAAAATSVGVGPTSVPPSIVVDRPFIFVIRERLSGTILFIGRVMHPSGS